MNVERRSALLRAIQYHDVRLLRSLDRSLFREEEIILQDESNGAQLPLLAMAIQEACTTRFRRKHVNPEMDTFLNILVGHCHLDVNRPFEIHGRPAHPSVILSELYKPHKCLPWHGSVMQPMDRNCLICTDPLSWAFYLFLQDKTDFGSNSVNCIVTLLHLGANVHSPFFLQISHGSMDPKGDSEWNARSGHSFLHLGLESGNYVLLEHLFRAKAHFNWAQDRGSLAKCLVSVFDDTRITEPDLDMSYIFENLELKFRDDYFDPQDLQVLRSADPRNGNSAFHYLALYEDFQGNSSYIDFLSEILVNPSAPNHKGLTPLELLESTGTIETMQKKQFREELRRAIEKWSHRAMTSMVTWEGLEQRKVPLEIQRQIVSRIPSTVLFPESLSKALSINARIQAARASRRAEELASRQNHVNMEQ